MSRGPTQRARVLRQLINAEKHGITARDFLLPDVCDGGRPITRLASRIDEIRAEIRAEGRSIDASGRRHGFVIYRLIEAAPRPAPPASQSHGDESKEAVLFDPAIGAAPPAGAIGDWEPEP